MKETTKIKWMCVKLLFLICLLLIAIVVSTNYFSSEITSLQSQIDDFKCGEAIVKIPLADRNLEGISCFYYPEHCHKKFTISEALQLILDTEGYTYQPETTEVKEAKLVR